MMCSIRTTLKTMPQRLRTYSGWPRPVQESPVAEGGDLANRRPPHCKKKLHGPVDALQKTTEFTPRAVLQVQRRRTKRRRRPRPRFPKMSSEQRSDHQWKKCMTSAKWISKLDSSQQNWFPRRPACIHPTGFQTMVKDEINAPIALSAFRDKGSRLWSFLKKKKKRKRKKVSLQTDRGVAYLPSLSDLITCLGALSEVWNVTGERSMSVFCHGLLASLTSAVKEVGSDN